MKIRVISLASALIVMFSAIAAAVFLPGRINLFASTLTSSVQTSSGYYMRNYHGKIGIYHAGSSTPYEVLDVYVNTLPEKDQEMLEAGIYLQTNKELMALIEDYSS